VTVCLKVQCCVLGVAANIIAPKDLPDGGASHFASTIRKLKQKCGPFSMIFSQSGRRRRSCVTNNRAPHILVEALTGDFQGKQEDVALVAQSGLDVYAHNLETVEALTPYVRDRRAKFRQSLRVLEMAKQAQPGLITKTSLMLGVGEEDHQVEEALRGTFVLSRPLSTRTYYGSLMKNHPLFLFPELRKIDVDVVTFGQYMRPTKRHMKVHSYVAPEKFDHWARVAEDMGFLYVASGPLVRSSFKANQLLKSAAGRRLLKGIGGRERGVEVPPQVADGVPPATETVRGR
jgi:lipoic acid synthetase